MTERHAQKPDVEYASADCRPERVMKRAREGVGRIEARRAAQAGDPVEAARRRMKAAAAARGLDV